MRAKFGLRGLLMSSLLLVSARGHAEDPRDPAAAEELFRQGRAAAGHHDFATACTKFRESNRLDPAVGTLFNIADCEEKLGRLATSWTLFQEVAQRLANSDERHAIAASRAQALEPRVPKLLVHLVPSSISTVQVRRDGVVLGAASLDTALPVDPGEHWVIVDASGTERAQFRAMVGEGEQATLEVRVGAALPAKPRHGDPSHLPSDRPNLTAAYVLGGIGVAGLVTGAVAGVLVLDRRSTVDQNCQGHTCSQVGVDAAHSGKTWGVVTTLSLVTGALGLGAATYLFLSAPAPTENARSGAYFLGIRAKW